MLRVHFKKIANRWYVKYSSHDAIANAWGSGIKDKRCKQLLELNLPAKSTKNALYIEFNDPADEAFFMMSDGVEIEF